MPTDMQTIKIETRSIVWHLAKCSKDTSSEHLDSKNINKLHGHIPNGTDD